MLTVPSEPPEFAFRRKATPRIRVPPGDRVRVETSDASYHGLTGAAIDANLVDFQRSNRLSGPIWVDGAEPGDALGFSVESIAVNERAFAVYVARWRSVMFHVAQSEVVEVAVKNGFVHLGEDRSFALKPMIGCIGVAPARGAVSSLAPTGPTGGNMDLPEIASGATIWFPVEVPGGLLSMGDLHARMGRGEPLGSGLECGGIITGRVQLAKQRRILGPVFCTAARVGFVGTSNVDWRDAEAVAIRAAWEWLTLECGMAHEEATVVAAALLEVDAGGPAGNNVVASFPTADLLSCGVEPGTWPMGEFSTQGDLI